MSEVPGRHINQDLSFALYICNRKEFLPVFQIRKARVEDCDDLVPIFKKHGLLNGKDTDHYLASLVYTRNEADELAMVAESGGEVVGFMSVNTNIDQEKLRNLYDLEPFNNLDSIEYVTWNPNKQSSSSNINENLQNTVGIKLFCIDPDYASYSYQFINVIFNHFKRIEYCAISHEPNTPELVLLKSFIPVKHRDKYSDTSLLYLTSCFGNREVLTVRRANISDRGNIERILDRIPNFQHTLRILDGLEESKGNSKENQLIFRFWIIHW